MINLSDTLKISFNISRELLKKIDDYANSLHINRTSAMSVLMSQALEQRDAVNVMNNMPNLLAKIEAFKVVESKDSE